MNKLIMNFYSKQIKIRRILKYFSRLFNYMKYMLAIEIRCIFCRSNHINEYYFQKDVDKTELDVAFLGILENIHIDSSEKINNIKQQLDNPDLILAYNDIEFCDKENDIYYLSKGSVVKIKYGERILGCTAINLKEYKSVKQIEKEMIIRKSTLKKENCEFLVAYIIGGEKQELAKKIIGLIGYDYVICIENGIKPIRGYRTIPFSETRVFYSIGKIKKKYFNNKVKYYSEVLVAPRIKIGNICNKVRVVNEGYIPILISKEGLITRINKNIVNSNSKKIINKYLYIDKVMRGFRNWDELITLNEIVDVLNITLPDKYKELGKITINQICARTFELAPGNIFFFREQFNDNNDVKLQSELWRTRLALKAYTRKALFVFSYKKLPRFIPHMIIDDTTEAHIKTIAWYREKFLINSFIGVTGSIGKTSTKDMIYCALKNSFNTEKNVRNTNVQVKIGINVQNIPYSCEMYVQEIGGGRPGGASRHSRMVEPIITVITNIGTAHIGNYGSKEALLESKLGIIEGMPQNGVLLMNADDELLWKSNPSCNKLFYGIKNKNADYYADNITEINGKSCFEIVHNNQRIKMEINVLGEYNILNAVCAYAIAHILGAKDENIKKGLLDFKTEGIRQNTLNINGYRLFLDCYNASIESVDSSLSVLSKMKCTGKKIAIIGEITGVGDLQDKINEKVAYILSKYEIDEVVCYGENSNEIVDYLKSYDIKQNICNIVKSSDLEKWILKNVEKGDITLFKGSSKSKLALSVDKVFGINSMDQGYIDEAKMVTFYKGNFEYKVFPEYVSIKKYNGIHNNIIIKHKFAGKPVMKIWQKAFQNNEHIKNITIREGIAHIGTRAFYNCNNLETIIIPKSVKYIGKEAFFNCKKLKKIVINGEPIYIGKDAFRNCNGNLQIISKTKDIRKRI